MVGVWACRCSPTPSWSPRRCTLGGLPVGFALTGAKADERQTLLGIFGADPGLVADRPGQILIGDKNYYGREFEAALDQAGVRLLRPARKGEPDRAGARLFKPLRQTIESINETFKGQLDLERHGGHTPAGVLVRVLQRILALTAAIWHNDRTGQPWTTPRRRRPPLRQPRCHAVGRIGTLWPHVGVPGRHLAELTVLPRLLTPGHVRTRGTPGARERETAADADDE